MQESFCGVWIEAAMIWELCWGEVGLHILVADFVKIMEDVSIGNLPENYESSIFVLIFPKMYFYNKLGFLTLVFLFCEGCAANGIKSK